MSDERACATCPVIHPHGKPRHVTIPQACQSCRLDLDDLLAEIPALVAQTTDKIAPERIRGEIVSGSRELPAPVNLTALGVTVPPYARGPRSSPELDLHHDPGAASDQVGIGQPAATLDQWVADWIDLRDQGEHPPDPDLSSIVSWLRHRLEWACDYHPAIDEFARECKDMAGKLRGIVRDADTGTYVGRCPAKLRDDTRCDTRLTVDPYLSDVIKCARCGSEWNRRKDEWVTFRAQQDEWDSKQREEAA